MIVDASAIRAHVAARLIIYYCNSGKRTYFIKPLWDSPLFSCYWGISTDGSTVHDSRLSHICLTNWVGDLSNFLTYPILMLFRKHSEKEQAIIMDILENHDDWCIK